MIGFIRARETHRKNKQFDIGIDENSSNKYAKDSKKINDRSGSRVTRRIVELLEKKGVRILSFYNA